MHGGDSFCGVMVIAMLSASLALLAAMASALILRPGQPAAASWREKIPRLRTPDENGSGVRPRLDLCALDAALKSVSGSAIAAAQACVFRGMDV